MTEPADGSAPALLGVNRLSMPPAEVALAVTGYERGTITPLGSTTAWPVVADARIDGRISLGGGAHGVGLTVDAAALLAALDARVADVTDPAPRRDPAAALSRTRPPGPGRRAPDVRPRRWWPSC